MNTKPVDQATITVSVPLTIRKRGGRKLVLSPAGEEITTPARQRIDNTLVKALARAFRWRKLLENGVYATVAEMADAEAINRSYVSRVLRLTLLAPEIVETILEGRVGTELVMPDLLAPRPELWAKQQLVRGRGCVKTRAWKLLIENIPWPFEDAIFERGHASFSGPTRPLPHEKQHRQ